MKTCVMFLMTGPSHLPNLAVATRSLRQWWQGDVKIYAWPESIEVARQIAEDPRVCAEAIPCDAVYKGKNAQEIAKIALIQTITSHDMVVYVDADMIFNGNFDYIVRSAQASLEGFAATQFCDWTMRRGVARTRVERLFQFDVIPKYYIEAACRPMMPSYNSGIFATSPRSSVLPVWGHWTDVSKSVYISGESTLHPISQMFSIATLHGGAYNCSTIYQPPNLKDEDVKVWHFHGDSNLRPGKSERGLRMWWPHFQETLKENIGGIQGWVETAGATNRHFFEARKFANDNL